VEIRCQNKLHGILIEHGVLEVKCDSGFCGAGNGVVVFHRFSMATGELIETKRYKDTPKTNKRRTGELNNAGYRTAVRPS
jgi:hypothetical protein